MSAMKSLEQVRREFSTQRKCEKHLQRQRWPDGITCPRCGTRRPYLLKTQRLWECRSCKYQFSVTAGTIFHRSKVPLPKWYTAIWLMCNSPKGISAKALERHLGVHYETAWYMAKRIRTAMKHDVFEDRLCGIIEVDEAQIKTDGGSGPYGHENVLGMTSREGPLRLQVLESLKSHDIKRVVARNFGEVQEIFSDAANKMRFLQQFGPHR